jgi:putative ABC transport system permease protein
MKYLFKRIIRNFSRRPVTNLINLAGLTISLTLVLLLSAYCYYELTTDKYQKNGERVFLYLPSDDRIYTPGILKENIDLKVPGAESALRISGSWEVPVFQAENKEPVNSDLLFSDEDFFEFFSYSFIEGDPVSALKDPLTVVITKTLASKLFSNEKAIGKIIRLNNSSDLTVSAVIDEPEANSCLTFSAVTSMATRKIVNGESGELTEWGWCDFQTFLLMSKGASTEAAEKAILSIIPEQLREDYKNARLVPFEKLYFTEFMLYGDYLVNGDRTKVILLMMVAMLVLAIGLVNFINISSAQWFERIRQTGVMKVFGARRSELLTNAFLEAFVFFLIALVMAICLMNAVGPLIENYTGIHYSHNLTFSPGFIFISFAGILLFSVVFSIIPAFRISFSRALDNLKSTLKQEKTGYSLSAVLVTMQFTIAIALIICTLLIQKQIRFGSSGLGFNKENILSLKMTSQLDEKKEVLKRMLLEKALISEVSFSQFYPGNDFSSWGVEMDIDGDKKQLNFDTFSADASFLKMMGLELVKGRYYTDELSTDKNKVIVNESFLKQNNLINAVGKKFSPGKREFEIVGVIKDFHFKPVNQPISPLAIRNEPFASFCLVTLKPAGFAQLTNIIHDIRAMVSELSPAFPVEVGFLDQAVEDMYKSEIQFKHTFSLFAMCSLIICCLGIFAMALSAGRRKVKEIGIRKVNGASTLEILSLLNMNFLKWVGIAFIIACPFSWLALQKWLQNYAYKTELSWWIFATAGVISAGIALLTITLQSWQTARMNPAEALHHE